MLMEFCWIRQPDVPAAARCRLPGNFRMSVRDHAAGAPGPRPPRSGPGEESGGGQREHKPRRGHGHDPAAIAAGQGIHRPARSFLCGKAERGIGRAWFALHLAVVGRRLPPVCSLVGCGQRVEAAGRVADCLRVDYRRHQARRRQAGPE